MTDQKNQDGSKQNSHAHGQDRDHISGVETTGHEWDGLKELNNPAPRWWLIVLLISVIWSVGYWVVYPAWPTITSHTRGIWGWTQHRELNEELAEVEGLRAKLGTRFDATPLADIEKDPELLAYARTGGGVAFRNYCAACHGSGGAGGPGYPNLNDDSWIWGGTIDQIYATLLHGVRDEADNTSHQSMMPAFGKDGLLTADEIGQVTDYVLTLASPKTENTPSENQATAPAVATAGATIFANNCAACHGPNGEGSIELGAPALNDAIWLYGGTRADVLAQVNKPKHGMMPAWGKRLDERTLRQLAVYVHSMGGGK